EVDADPKRVRPALMRQAVDDLIHPIDTACRASGECAKRSNPGDAHSRPGWIGGWRLEVAEGDLTSCLVHSSGRKRDRVSECDGLINILEPGRCGCRIQSTRAARVIGPHVIKAVAN